MDQPLRDHLPLCADRPGRRLPGADLDDGREFAEDPVTGSANAGLAQWLIGTGALPTSYVARQGSVIAREGRVHIAADAGRVWVSGDAATRIVGEVDLQRETHSASDSPT